MKIVSPFGEYPFVFERLEHRRGTLVVVGTVAGVESRVVLDRDDLRTVAKLMAAPVAALALGIAVNRHRRTNSARSPKRNSRA